MGARHFTIKDDGAETASFTTPAIEATAPEFAIGIDVTAASGTSPTMDITVEWSPDGVNWGTADTPQTVAQITGTGVTVALFSAWSRFYRLSAVLGGTTPSFTAKIVGSHYDRS